MKNYSFTHSVETFTDEWFEEFATCSTIVYKLEGRGDETIEVRKIDNGDVAYVFRHCGDVKGIDFFTPVEGEKTKPEPVKKDDRTACEMLDDLLDMLTKKPKKEEK